MAHFFVEGVLPHPFLSSQRSRFKLVLLAYMQYTCGYLTYVFVWDLWTCRVRSHIFCAARPLQEHTVPAVFQIKGAAEGQP